MIIGTDSNRISRQHSPSYFEFTVYDITYDGYDDDKHVNSVENNTNNVSTKWNNE